VTNTPQLAPSTTVSAFSLAFDKNNDLYVSGTSSVDGTSYLTPYTGIGGTGTPVAGTSISYAAGITPRSVTVTTNSDFVYTANEGDSTISPASLSGTGVVTAVGAPILGPTNVSAVGVDSTDTYLIAAGFSSVNGLQLFSIGTTGALSDTGVTFASGTDATVPVLLAVSH
jgi:6-phosphogluconolactonase (cycloisomerase 2 family)